MYLYKTYIILCEGPSERAYLEELNRFLRDKNIQITFISKIVGCGHYKEISKRYKKEKKQNPTKEIIIWVDRDTYIRNDNNDRDFFNKSLFKENFYFSTMNFEDFLVMHLDTKKLSSWEDLCLKNDHFSHPLTEENYIPLFIENIFSKYTKGNIPFEINNENLQNLFCNNNLSRFKSKFASFLENTLKPYL